MRLMRIVVAVSFISMFLTGNRVEADAEGFSGVATAVGLLPLEVAGETHSSDLSLSLLQRAQTEEEAALKSEQLQEALLRDKESTIRNLFVAWSKVNNKFYARLSESEIALQTFRQNVEQQLTADNATSEWFTAATAAIGGDGALFEAAQPSSDGADESVEDEAAARATSHKPRFSHLFRTRRLLGDPVPVLKKTVPAAYNHSALGNLPPVVNQGLNCASCWANSAALALSAAVVIYYKSLTPPKYITPMQFSRQALVDCVNVRFTGKYFYSADNGCSLGSPGDAFYFAANYSIPLETAYPYVSAITAAAGVCKSSLLNLSPTQLNGTWATITGVLHYTDADVYGNPLPISETNLMKAVYNQPLVMLWAVSTNMILNKGEVFTVAMQNDPISGCFNSPDYTDHAMTLVGYDSTATVPIWIIQNSWGQKWGNNGFLLAQMTHNVQGPCGMYYYIVAPTVGFSHTPSIPAGNVLSAPAPAPPSPKPSPPRTG